MNVAKFLSRTILLLIVSLGWATEAPAKTLPRSVLIIDQSDPTLPFWASVHSAIRITLNSRSSERIAVYDEYLDFNRFSSPAYIEALRTYFRAKYAETPIGVIVTLGQRGLEFALRLRAEQWPEVPIVFGVVDDEAPVLSKNNPNVTGATSRVHFHDMITAARALVPGLKQVALVGDPYERQASRRHFRQQILEVAKELKVQDLTGLPISVVRSQVAALPSEAAILYTAIYTDGAGATFIPHEALAIVAEVAKRPIVIDAEVQFGYGGTGGFVIRGQPVGETAAHQVLRILAGESASEIPIMVGNFRRPVFDWRELNRLNISEKRLPVGSEVRFKSPTLWEQYRWQMMGICAAFLLQAAVISALLVERHRRQRAERESRGRLLEVMHLNSTAAAGALSASIAHELNQPLGAIMSNTEAAELLLGVDPPDISQVKEILSDIRQADQRAADIIQHLRKLLKRRGEVELQEFDLNAAIVDAVDILSAEAKKRNIALSANGIEQPLRVRADQVHVQQVLLNLATNGMDAVADSPPGARNVTIETSLSGKSQVEVSISDSGTGIPKEKLSEVFETFYTTKQHGTGLGLSIARTIVETYGGKIWAKNHITGGAVFCFTLPLLKAHPS